MTDHDALLRAISDQPAEDTPRLMYADWLEEHGQPERAEFVRTQVELARMKAGDPARRPWVVKNVAFLRDWVPRWKAELPRLDGVEWGDFRRGLVEEVQAADQDAVVRHAKVIFAEPAVHVLRLRRLTNGRALAAVPELDRLRALRLISAPTDRGGADEAQLRALLASPHLGRLIVLDLHGNGAADAAAEDIADGRFPALEELWLGSNAVGDEGGLAIARSPHLTRLRVLDLRGNRITAHARVALMRRFGSELTL